MLRNPSLTALVLASISLPFAGPPAGNSRETLAFAGGKELSGLPLLPLQPLGSIEAGGSAIAGIAADLDGAGGVDLALLSSECNEDGCTEVAVILLNRDDGTFLAAARVPVADFAGSLAAADLDGDGDADLIALGYLCDDGGCDRGLVSVLLNSGSGAFSPSVSYEVGSGAPTLKVMDLDGDGHPDLVTGGSADGALMNRGNGSFTAQRP